MPSDSYHQPRILINLIESKTKTILSDNNQLDQAVKKQEARHEFVLYFLLAGPNMCYIARNGSNYEQQSRSWLERIE